MYNYKFQKRHYEDIAGVLRRMKTYNDNGDTFIRKSSLMSELIMMFGLDNPNFNSKKFVEACKSVLPEEN